MSYFILAPIALFLKLFQALLGWLLIAPFIWVRMDGNYPALIRAVFQPADTPAIGDTMYGNREARFTSAYPRWIAYYIRAVMWGARNPAYGFDHLCGVAEPDEILHVGNPTVDIGYNDTTGATIATYGAFFAWDDHTHFQFKFAFTYLPGLACMGTFGWSLLTDGNLQIDFRPFIKV